MALGRAAGRERTSRREGAPVRRASGAEPGAATDTGGAGLGASARLATIGGIEINVHASWLLIFGLVGFSLATAYFPAAVPGLDPATAWLLGGLAALLLFACVVAHELAHSVVARSLGLEVRSITLFLFGGVSNLAGEAKRPSIEFRVAIAGPLTSFALAAAAFGFAVLVDAGPAVEATAGYLALINVALGLFNLLPGFPLDGGRVLRSLVWSATNNLRRATEIASAVGQLVAWGLVIWGFLRIFQGDLIGGLWIAAIGWFLQNAAVVSLQQTVLETRLRDLTAGDVIGPVGAGALPTNTVAEVVDGMILPTARRAVPVVDDGRLVGLVTLGDVAGVPRERWRETQLGAIMTPADQLVTVSRGSSLLSAIKGMSSGDYEQVPVVEDGRLIGLLSRSDVLRHLRVREALDVPSER